VGLLCEKISEIRANSSSLGPLLIVVVYCSTTNQTKLSRYQRKLSDVLLGNFFCMKASFSIEILKEKLQKQAIFLMVKVCQ
jgi:hypothetical protein